MALKQALLRATPDLLCYPQNLLVIIGQMGIWVYVLVSCLELTEEAYIILTEET